MIENYFQYDPNFFAAVLFATLFGLLTICTIVQIIYYKAGYMWVMAMGTTCTIISFRNLLEGMVIGFCFRTKGHSEPTDFAIYLLFQFFIVSCPDSLPKSRF
jgi:hypothetical protein